MPPAVATAYETSGWRMYSHPVHGLRMELGIVDHGAELDPVDPALAVGRPAHRHHVVEVGESFQPGRRDRVGAAADVAVDLAVDHGEVQRDEIACDRHRAVDEAARGLLEGGDLVVALLLERVQAGGHAEVHDVPVIVGEDAVAAGHVGIVEQVPALVLRRLGRDDVGVDHEVEGVDPLADTQQVVTVEAHRPFVRRLEHRQHRVEVRLEACPVELDDQPLRPHVLTRPRVVQVDDVPDGGLAGAELVDRVRVGGVNLVVDTGAVRLG